MPEQMKLLAKLKDLMPKSPEVEDAIGKLEEEAMKSYEAEGTTDGETEMDFGPGDNDEEMGLELDQSDADMGEEDNPEMSIDELDEEAGEPSEEDDLAKLRKMGSKAKKK